MHQNHVRSVPPPSTYAAQAARWKQGFQTSHAPRNKDRECQLIAELCGSAGTSSFPPRDATQRLLKLVNALDHEVQAKALSVLESLFSTSASQYYVEYFSEKSSVIEELTTSSKRLLKARAGKVLGNLNVESRPSVAANGQIKTNIQKSTILPTSPITANMPSIDLLSVYDQEDIQPTAISGSSQQVPEGSAFGFLNATPASSGSIGDNVQQQNAIKSAFSFLSQSNELQKSSKISSNAAHPTSTAASIDVPVDIFANLPAPIFAGWDESVPNESMDNASQEEIPKEYVDPIHDAFEGLDEDYSDPYTNHSAETLEYVDSAEHLMQEQIDETSSEPVSRNLSSLREVFLDVEVPEGPMGIALDRSITNMVVIEKFIPLPSGERGYLEMHPALCPGCVLVRINSIDVENKGLDEVGSILQSLASSPKILRFKKLLNNGRTANPVTGEIPYIPPPGSPRQVDPPQSHTATDEAEDSSSHMSRLKVFEQQLNDISAKVESIVQQQQTSTTSEEIDIKSILAQLHGDVEKIQTQGIDAVILGPSPPPNSDEIKKFRSALVANAEALAVRIHEAIKANEALSKRASLSSSFAFMQSQTTTTQEIKTEAPKSAFSFLSSETSNTMGRNNIEPKKIPTAFQFIQDNSPSPSSKIQSTTSSAFSFMS